MNKNLKAIISLVIIVVLIGLNFLLTGLVEKNPSLKISLTSDTKFAAETVTYFKKLDKPITISVISIDRYMEDPVVQRFNTIVKKLAAYNKNITLNELPFNNPETDTEAIQKYLSIQTEENPLTPITAIIESGDTVIFATPELNEEQQNYSFPTYEEVIVNKIQEAIGAEEQITIPANERLDVKEPVPFETSSNKKTSMILIYLILIPVIFFVSAGFLSKKKCVL